MRFLVQRVKNAKVTSYKRYIYDVDIGYIKKSYSSEVSFVNGLNRIISKIGNENITVEDMYLSYVVSKDGISDIMWTVIIDGEKYTETIEMSE